MADLTRIYVYLDNEGTDVWRPVDAEHLGGDRYRIVSANADPENERWRFATGDVVRCVVRTLCDATPHACLVATEKIVSSPDPTPAGDGPRAVPQE